jgi:hypothetical protein
MKGEDYTWHLRPCAQLILWPMTLWLIFMGLVAQLDVLWWIRLALMPLPLPWLLSFWRRHCSLEHPEAVRKLTWKGGEWVITLSSGDESSVVIDGAPWVADWMLAVTFRDDRRRRFSIVSIPLQLTTVAYRRLSRLLLAHTGN